MGKRAGLKVWVGKSGISKDPVPPSAGIMNGFKLLCYIGDYLLDSNWKFAHTCRFKATNSSHVYWRT
jgi:hypothetical protein